MIPHKPDGKNLETILVRSPNWIGDQILAFYFFYFLRKAYPKAHITSVCVPWVSDLQYRTLVDEVIVLERPSGDGKIDHFLSVHRQGKEIGKKRDWDLSITLPNSFSSAWLLKRARAQVRRGYRFEGRGFLLNDPIPIPDETFQVQHRSVAYLELLPQTAQPKIDLNEFWDQMPEDELDDPIPGVLSFFDHEKYWPGFQQIELPNQGAEEYYWILAPGATAETRRWPMDYWIHLARLIAKQTNLVGIVVGGPQEAPIAERLCEMDGVRLKDFTARGPVPSLVNLFKGASFAVTNESGLAHVSALFCPFTQIICGAADPRRTKPRGPGLVQVSLNAVECWPCELNYCTQPLETKLQCLKGTKPTVVWEEIKRGLRKVTR